MESYKNNLSDDEYDDEDCLVVTGGQCIPQALSEDITRLCVIRGIRHHLGFAKELHGLLRECTCALNARNIMNNKVPKMKNKRGFPLLHLVSRNRF